jgi:tryptophanase
LVPQGRCAENLLFGTLSEILRETAPGKQMYIPSNGHFDTTEGNIGAIGAVPRNFFNTDSLNAPAGAPAGKNPVKGNMDTARLEAFIKEKGRDAIPLIFLTITNTTVAGQPVSMANIKTVSAIAQKHTIPFFMDACRFAENAYFIKTNEDGYVGRSIQEIVKEMFSLADGFTISFKKDGMANMGGGLFFRDRGVFHQRFSVNNEDIGVKLKERQISAYGNDSYGGMSGRDIFALAGGLYEVVKFEYLKQRIAQCEYLAEGFRQNGLPVILPAGGHAVYLDMTRFFDGKRVPADFAGVGFCVELLRRYGIRVSELGYFAFEYDKKPTEQQREIVNQVRFALPRNVLNKEHLDYTIAAVAELYRERESIPCMKIVRGAQLRMRHFQTGLAPVKK